MPQENEFRSLVDVLRSEYGYSWRKINDLAGYRGKNSARTAYDRGVQANRISIQKLRTHLSRLQKNKAQPSSEGRAATPAPTPTAVPRETRGARETRQSGGGFYEEIEGIRGNLWDAANRVETMMQGSSPPFVIAGLQEVRERLYGVIEYMEG